MLLQEPRGPKAHRLLCDSSPDDADRWVEKDDSKSEPADLWPPASVRETVIILDNLMDKDNFLYLFNRGIEKVEAKITRADARKEYIGKAVLLSRLVHLKEKY
jgi:hypothetical protein